MRRFACVASAIAALSLLDATPESEISICNDFKARIYVALAFENQGNFTAAGWWTVDSNKCEPAVFSFPSSSLYYTADSDQYAASNGGTSLDHWGSATKLFISSKQFSSDHTEQSRDGTEGEMFSSVKLTEQQQSSPVKIIFHFLPGNTMINVNIKKQ